MRVLFVIHTPKDSLTAVYDNIRGRADFLRAQGYQADVLAPDDFLRLKRLPHRLLPLIFPLGVALWLLRRRNDYDLAVFHSYSGWAFNLLRNLLPPRRLRTVTSFHGLEPLHYEKLKQEMARAGKPLSFRYRVLHGWLMLELIRLSCRRSDLVQCLNQEEALYLRQHRWAAAAKIAVVPNPISKEFFISRPQKPEARRLLFVGQWLERKGIRYLIEAFTGLTHNWPELTLWCVGTLAPEEEVLSSFPEASRRRVVARARVRKDELIRIYQEADIFVFPSLHEGFSHALIEAMAAGLPIVTTPVGAAPDILEGGDSALLVPVGDSAALSSAVGRLMADTVLREQIGARAQAAAHLYESNQVYQNYLALLQSVLDGQDRMIDYHDTIIEPL